MTAKRHQTTPVHEWENLLREFDSLPVYTDTESDLVPEIKQLLEDFNERLDGWREEQKSRADDFNVLRTMRLSRRELCHSDILAWLLDPHGSHAQGNIGFRLFLKQMNLPEEFASKNYRVIRELSGEESQLDIVIEAEGKFIIGIENKIFHFLNNDLNDYSQTVSSLCRANSKKAITFVLSLKSLTNQQDREKIKESGFKNVTYIDLFENIKKNWGDFISTANPKYDILLKDFIKSIQNLTSRTMENKELWGFFKENAEDIEYLTSGFLDYRNFLFQKVYPLMDMLPQNEYAPNCIKQWVIKVRVVKWQAVLFTIT